MPLPTRASVGHILANRLLQNVTSCGHRQGCHFEKHGMAKDFLKACKYFNISNYNLFFGHAML